MKVEAITSKVLHIQEVLLPEMLASKSISIGSSFIDAQTINILELVLKKNKKLKNFRLLVGVYGNFNRKSNLSSLFHLAKKYAIKLEVHISRSKNFHWKYYHFVHSRNESLFLGSANFTSGGLFENNELLVKLSDRQTMSKNGISKVTYEFEKEWQDSGPIADFNLNEYKERVLPSSKSLLGKSGNEDFFSRKRKAQTTKPLSDKAFIVYLRYSASATTEKMVNNVRPDWQDIDYFICGNRRVFEQCKAITDYLILEKNGGVISAYWGSYKGDLELKTPDGNYFIAHDIINSKPRIPEKTLNQLTDRKGVWKLNLFGRKRVTLNKVIGKNQKEKIEELLRMKIRK